MSSIPGCVIWIFFTLILPAHYGSGVDSASNRNEYQEYFLGGKGGRCVRVTTLPPSCAVIMKSGNLNFLELSGPLQAWNGTALPLPLLDKLFLISNFRRVLNAVFFVLGDYPTSEFCMPTFRNTVFYMVFRNVDTKFRTQGNHPKQRIPH